MWGAIACKDAFFLFFLFCFFPHEFTRNPKNDKEWFLKDNNNKIEMLVDDYHFICQLIISFCIKYEAFQYKILYETDLVRKEWLAMIDSWIDE